MFGGFCVHRLNRGNPKIGLCLEKGHSVKKGEREKALNLVNQLERHEGDGRETLRP